METYDLWFMFELLYKKKYRDFVSCIEITEIRPDLFYKEEPFKVLAREVKILEK